MKSILYWAIAAILVMLLLPWLVMTLATPSDIMGVVVLLFFMVDPLFALVTGIFASARPRERWHLPLVNACLLLAGTWLFFEFGETDFLIYAVACLAIGMAAMLGGWLVRSMTKRLKHHHQRSRRNQHAADEGADGKLLVQENKGQDQR